MALDTVWSFAAGEYVSVAALQELRQNVERLIPDFNDPEAPEQAPLVLEAAGAVSYAIQSALSGSSKPALSAGVSALTAVHDWIAGLLHPGLTVVAPGNLRCSSTRLTGTR
jgi:hypothetical protein